MARFNGPLRPRLSTLTARERKILALRYGSTSPKLSYEEVAAQVGLSSLEVCRLERQALQRLRRLRLETMVWDEA